MSKLKARQRLSSNMGLFALIMWRINKGIVMTLMAVESEEIKYPTAK
jgi:hypothetical protein